MVFSLFLLAAVSASADGFSGVLTSKLASNYIQQNGVKAYDHFVWQSDLLLKYSIDGANPVSVYGDVWGSHGLDGNNVSRMGEEVDYTVGITVEPKKLLYVDLGLIYNDFNNFDGLGSMKGDYFKPFLEVGKKIAIGENNFITPFARMELPMPAKGDVPEGGVLTFIGAKHLWKIAKPLDFNQQLRFLWDDGVAQRDTGLLMRWRGEFEYRIIPAVGLTAEAMLNAPLTELRKDNRVTIWTGLFGGKIRF